MKTIFVGMSGGVDSSVSALLLQRAGYNVVGVFIKIWQPEFIACTWREDRLDAMRVAAQLEIPFREIDLSAEYKRDIIDTMTHMYAHGQTPNPDVACNTYIKFGAFYDWARSEGADIVATGHYAQIKQLNNQAQLYRGLDTSKDQSYFLHTMPPETLAHVLFPVGGISKKEVRAIASKNNLPVATKSDSQGLCFVGDVTMADFLKHYISIVPGNVIDLQDKIVGTHAGAALYTIGQRHGFDVASTEPLYVVNIDTADNTITVSNNKFDAARTSVQLSHMSWLGERPLVDYTYSVQTRYRETPISATITYESTDMCTVTFVQPHIVAPGQSLVIYDGDRCMGGGVMVV